MTYFVLFYNRSLSGSLEDTAVYKKTAHKSTIILLCAVYLYDCGIYSIYFTDIP